LSAQFPKSVGQCQWLSVRSPHLAGQGCPLLLFPALDARDPFGQDADDRLLLESEARAQVPR